ncbi:TPA: hypothetical protein ENX78_11235, partial [Candidatus Poribacteria bacterium]|nr:hypothetical protein [Candidatus Poribacteria bacterium]
SNTNVTLYDVEFINRNEGYAVGANGTVLHTTDGGNTWVLQEANTTYDLYDINLSKDGSLWIVGKYGIILKHKLTQTASAQKY